MWGWTPKDHEEFMCLSKEENCAVQSIYNIQVMSASVLHNFRVQFHSLGT